VAAAGVIILGSSSIEESECRLLNDELHIFMVDDCNAYWRIGIEDDRRLDCGSRDLGYLDFRITEISTLLFYRCTYRMHVAHILVMYVRLYYAYGLL
jgi:hypothetical protein